MSFEREADEAEARRMVNLAFDHGINFFDTADSYSRGRSEEILGQVLEGRRDQIVLATKGHNPTGNGPNDQGSSRYHIVRAVEASLRRLKTDRIDLYQLHRFDFEVPLEETLRAMDDLVRWGKIVYIGCSNFTALQLKEALNVSDNLGLYRFISIQPMYNILKREIEHDLFPLCSKEGIGVVCYNPLAGGFLTGKYKPDVMPPAGTRLGDRQAYRDRYLSDENFLRADRFLKAAERREIHPIALSIGWINSHPAVTCTIIGARNGIQLKETLRVSNLRMSEEERDAITEEVWHDPLS
jgi:aryl-alcohol dehydrogenase-like predicted oxidoreductase